MSPDAAPSPAGRPARSRRNRRVGLSEGGARFVAIGGLRRFSDRYTSFVGFLKLVLPTIAVAIVGLVLMWPQIKATEENLRQSFSSTIRPDEVENLHMVRARYVGTDDQNRPFVVTAAAARQVSSGSDMVALELPKGHITMEDGVRVGLSAEAGAYYQEAQLLDLFGAVTMTQSTGYTVETAEARINLAEGSAEGSKPVSGHGPAGTLRSEGFRILDKGQTVLFTGKSRMVIAADSADAQGVLPGLPDVGARREAAAEDGAMPGGSDAGGAAAGQGAPDGAAPDGGATQ